LVWATAGACDGEGPSGALHPVWQHCVGALLSSIHHPHLILSLSTYRLG
jgi:hypothetical protein